MNQFSITRKILIGVVVLLATGSLVESLITRNVFLGFAAWILSLIGLILFAIKNNRFVIIALAILAFVITSAVVTTP